MKVSTNFDVNATPVLTEVLFGVRKPDAHPVGTAFPSCGRHHNKISEYGSVIYVR